MLDVLDQSIQDLYRAFADVPRPQQVDGCTHCCITETELQRLVHIPLYELSAADLSAYAYNALDTVGSEADFRYLLPRIFDLSAHQNQDLPECSWVVRRLRLINWQLWSEVKQHALLNFLLAWWMTILHEASRQNGQGQNELDEALASLLMGVPDPGLFLDYWLAGGRNIRATLAWFILEHLPSLQKGETWNTWTQDPAAVASLMCWFRSGRPGQVMAQESHEEGDDFCFREAWCLLCDLTPPEPGSD